MPDGPVGTALVLTGGGRQALSVLRTRKPGRVAAVFDRSFYIAFGRDLVCLGPWTLPLGPLNIRSSAPPGVIREACGVHIDDAVSSSPDMIRVGRTLAFGMVDVTAWDPPRPPAWTGTTLKAGLDGLDRLVHPGADAGLADFVLPDWPDMPGNRVAAAAGQPVDALARAAERAFRDAPFDKSALADAVIALLGLGPGLTPSGDDFLAGLSIALHSLPAPALRDALRTAVERHAPQRTNAISLAHLRAAGAGAGHAALHDILNSLLSGDTAALPTRLAAIDGIGHSSGRDALAGVCVALRAFLTVRSARDHS